VNEGCVPSTWKHAVITPVPKVKPVTKIADLIPISVTPVFSRITERLSHEEAFVTCHSKGKFARSVCVKIVRQHNICSGFSNRHCRQTAGSKQRCIMIDFSKAFDTVNHEILL